VGIFTLLSGLVLNKRRQLMDNLVEQLRSGVDNVDGGELGGVVLTMNLAANRIEELESELRACEEDKIWRKIHDE
jgi:hypothetical protein